MLPHPTLTEYEVYQVASEIMNKQRKNRHVSYDEKINMMQDDLQEMADISVSNLGEDLRDFLLHWTTCMNCTEGYKLLNNTCTRCPTNCLSCDEQTCFECEPTTSLSMNGTECLPCEFPCYECHDHYQRRCLSCEAPYELNNEGNCTKCEKPC